MADDPKPLNELDKEIMFGEFIRGSDLKAIASKHGINYRRLLRISNKEDWKDKKALVQSQTTDLAKVDTDTLQNEAITRTLRVLHKIAADTETMLLAGSDVDQLTVKMNIKTMVDAIDKLVRLKMHVESGGVEKKEVNVKKQTIDWNQMIEQATEARKKFGEDFNEKEFLAKVIDIEVGSD